MKRVCRSAPLLLALLAAACGDDGASNTDASVPIGCVEDPECDDGTFCNGPETCSPDSPSANRFGCVTGERPCGLRECEEATQFCEPECPDADMDGFLDAVCGGDDCDDADSDRFPGNTEVCDEGGHDEDCDPSTFGERDIDGDRFIDAACCNVVGDTSTCGLDCDDTASGVNPAVPEVCNGFDDNCDSDVDTDCGCSTPGSSEPCGTERDGVGTCLAGTQECEGGSLTACSGVLPTEDDYLCDGQDEDCDGVIDEGLTISCVTDADEDGYGDLSDPSPVIRCPDPASMGAPRFGCGPGDTRADNPEDCCDSDGRANPGVGPLEWFATEVGCGGFDFDCDGTTIRQFTTKELQWCFATPTCYCRDNCGSGWEMPDRDPLPGCGATLSWCSGCGLTTGGACVRECEERVQACR